MEKVSGAQLVVQFLKRIGIHHAFGLVGYQVSPIFVSCEEEGFEIYDVRHEQAAIHMADGYTNITGKPGVALTVGGPGFTNAVSGIIKAYFSHTPMLVITGAQDTRKKYSGALQDLDQLSLIRQFTVWSGTVDVTERIPEYISIALRHAITGRRGPAVLEIPINYLVDQVDPARIHWPEKFYTDAKILGDPEKVLDAIRIFRNSRRPLLIAGNGVFYDGARHLLKEFVETLRIPVYTANAARGSLPDDHELCFGEARPLDGGPQLYALEHADTILFLGNSIDYTFFGAKPPLFPPDQKIIQVDVDPGEIGLSGRGVDVGIVGNSGSVLQQMLDLISCEESFPWQKDDRWLTEIRNHHDGYMEDFWRERRGKMSPVDPADLLQTLMDSLPRNSILVRDGSNALLWAGLFFRAYEMGHEIIGPNGTFGPMGTGLPLALGAKVAKPESPVVLYTGDGSFGFNAMEIDTAIRLNLPIIIVVHNDGAWGFCRDTQEKMFPEKSAGYGTQLGPVRYDLMVQALGGRGEMITARDEIIPAIRRALESPVATCLNVIVDAEALSPGGFILNEALRKVVAR